MAHYAFLDENNIVQAVYVGMDENYTSELPEGFSSWEEYYTSTQGMTCKRTSYNTMANEHIAEGTPFRGNFAGPGFTYDTENYVFIGPKPYDSWVLNNSTWSYEAPIAKPDDGNLYDWDETAYQADNSTGWTLVE